MRIHRNGKTKIIFASHDLLAMNAHLILIIKYLFLTLDVVYLFEFVPFYLLKFYENFIEYNI